MEFVNENTLSEYNSFIDNHKKGHFLQTSYWSQVKKMWKFVGIISRDEDGNIKGAMSVLIRKMPGFGYSLLYSPRGPVCDIYDKETLKDLIDGIRKLATKYKAYEFRVDPDVLISDDKFIDVLKELGFEIKEAGKNFEGVQPRFVFRLNVEGKTIEELMESFSSKTRYNIRLATRKGVTVRLCDNEYLKEFKKIMDVTGSRDNFSVRSLSYFEDMMNALGENARLYMAFFEDKPIAGTIAIRYAHKVWYLYGASSNQYRNVMPNYLLQLEMIKWALETKSSIYDFRGVSGDITPENPLYGLYRFKKGFNGDFCEFIGDATLVFNKNAKKLIEFAQKSYKKINKLKSKLKK